MPATAAIRSFLRSIGRLVVYIAALVVALAVAGVTTRTAQQPTVPSLVFFEADQPHERLVRSAAAQLNDVRVTLSRTKGQQLLDKLFADRIGALAYIVCAKNLGLDVNMAQREELVRRETSRAHDAESLPAMTQQILTLDVLSNETVWSQGEPPQHPFGVFDLDRDGHPDLVLVPRMYFGPSAGWAFYANHHGTFKYLYDNAGEVLRVESTPGRTIVRFVIPIIDPIEPAVVVSLCYGHETRAWSGWKQYYAARTVFPKRFSTPRAFAIRGDVDLRVGPTLRDPQTEQLVKEERTTRTLSGNIVARYGGGARGYALGVQGEWAFVAFAPETPPTESSLAHGLEEGYSNDGVWTKGRAIEPHLCGWILRSAIR